MAAIDKIVEGQRNQLAKLESEYLRAVEYSKSQGRINDQLTALARIEAVVGGRQWTGESALVAMGRIQEILAISKEKLSVIVEYESIRNSIRESELQKTYGAAR